MVPEENATCEGTSGYSLVREKIKTDLDPELQNAILKNGPDEVSERRVDVIARLKDGEGAIPAELQSIQKVGDVLTGTLRVNDIVRVREHENVQSLKGARLVHETLDHSVPEIGASGQQLRAEFRGRDIDGSRVIIGVIDHGCDFAHPNFQNQNGTRILYLWDQRQKSPNHPPPRNFVDGREFTSEHINAAIQLGRPACYESLDYSVTHRPHGTRVLDIAAGSGTDFNPSGVAPRADIIFVDLADADQQDESLGNSRLLLNAVNYIFQKADELAAKEGSPRSVVINVSLSSDSGPHDGSSPFERGIDNLLQKPGRAVVIAAGNSAERFEDNDGIRTLERHASRLLQAPSPVSVKWQIRHGDTTDNKVDLWYGGRHELMLSLISPSGVDIGSFPLDTTTTVCRDGQAAARVFHRRSDPNNGDNEIIFSFTTRMETGNWTIMLTPKSVLPFIVHAWAESNGGKRSGFPNQTRDVSHTINSVACGYNTIAVGGYFSAKPEEILPESSEGPTRDGRLKPEISAPGAFIPFDGDEVTPSRAFGRGVRAAEAESDGSSRSQGGTSAAAPHVAGLIALLMQNADAPLSITEIRQQVISTSRRLNGRTCSWHPRFGHGRIDAAAAIISRTHPIFLVSPANAVSKSAVNLGNVNTVSVSGVLGTANTKSVQKGTTLMRKRQRLTVSESLRSLEQLDHATLTALGDGEEVDHTPIIITDGSVRIDFSSEEYAGVGAVFVSSGLNLHLIEAAHATHADGSNLCYFARPGELCIVVFHTIRASGEDETITIQGGLGVSPSITFRASEYPQDTAAPSHRRVHSNAQRRLTAMEIFRVRGQITERVHVCPLVSVGGQRRYRLWDPHHD